MAALTALDDSNFEAEVLQSPLPTAVLFKSRGCPFCTKMAPIVEEVAAEYAGRMKTFVLDVAEGRDTAIRYGILGVPQLLLFKGGAKAGAVVGWVPKAEVVKKLEELLR